MSSIVQDPQHGDDPVQDTANPQDGVDDSQNANPQGEHGDDSQQVQTEAKELPKFHYQFSKELQGHDAFEGMEKPDDLANSYIELKQKLEKLEGEKSGEEVSVESTEEYDFSKIQAPEGVTEEDVTSVKELAYNLGLSKEKAQELYKSIVSDYQKAVEQQQQQQEKHKEELKKEFGDEFNSKITEAHRAYEVLGSKELGDLLDSAGLGNHPTVVKAFLNMHEKIGEDSLIEGSGGTGKQRNIEKEWFPESSKTW